MIYFFVITSTIIIIIWLVNLLLNVFNEEYFLIADKSKEYVRSIEQLDGNTAANVGFLCMREYMNDSNKINIQIEKNIKATILELKIYNLINIYQDDFGNYYIEILDNDNKEILNKLTKAQYITYDFIKNIISKQNNGGKNTVISFNLFTLFIKTNEENFKSYVREFNKSILERQTEKGNYSNNSKNLLNRYFVMFAIALFVFGINLTLFICSFTTLAKMVEFPFLSSIVGGISVFLSICLLIYTRMNIKKVDGTSFGLTKKGLLIYNKCLGFKKFLEDYSLIEESKNLKDVIIRDEYLPYALVLGVSNKLLDEFGFDNMEIIYAFDEKAYMFKDMI